MLESQFSQYEHARLYKYHFDDLSSDDDDYKDDVTTREKKLKKKLKLMEAQILTMQVSPHF